jgi:hypothetical protein
MTVHACGTDIGKIVSTGWPEQGGPHRSEEALQPQAPADVHREHNIGHMTPQLTVRHAII